MLRSSHQSLPQAREGAAAVVNVHAELRGRHGRLPCQSWLHYEDARDRLVGGMVTRRKTMYTYYGGAEATQRRKHPYVIVGASHASCTAWRLWPYFIRTEFTACATRSKAHATSEGSWLMMAWCLTSIRIRVSLWFKCCDKYLYTTHVRAHGSPNVAEATKPKQIRNALQRACA